MYSEGDDGAFRRGPRRSDMDDREVSRSDGDSSWRRGGGSYGDSRGGYGDRMNSSGYNNSRMGGGDSDSGWRRGGGSSGFDSRAGGNDGGSAWRRGGSSGDRPRLNLTSRKTDGNASGSLNAKTSSKSNPFGSATAVDTASRFAKVDLREKEAAAAKDEVEKPAEEEKKDATQETEVAETKTTEEANEPTNDIGASEGEGPGKEDIKEGENGGEKKRERRERKMRQPKVVNSRAAMLGEAEAPKKEVSSSSV